MAEAEQNKLKEYLLDQLTEAEEEQLELRLLTEPAFAEEFDIVVNEITDDYIGGKFEGATLKQVEQYFFKSPARRNKLKFALALKKHKSDLVAKRRSRKQFFQRSLRIAASLLLVGGGFYIWQVSSNSDLNKGLAALQSAFRAERPLEARISKFDYAPYATTRGPGTDKVDQDELQLAELTLRQALKSNPTPALHYGLGKVLLAKKQFDDAIKEFDEALKGDPNNAQLYSDLGAAWLEKGKADLDKAQNDPAGPDGGNAVQEFGKALENINGALKLNRNVLEAVFNRALYHKYMKLGPQEEADLREYINQEPNSQWADEARQRLRTLEAERKRLSETKEEKLEHFRKSYRAHNDSDAWAIVSSYQNRSGNLIVDQLLDGYLAAAGRGASDEATENLSSLKYAGKLSLERAGDSFFSDVVHFYAHAQPGQQNEVAQARAVMKTAHEGWGESKVEDSLSSFIQARELFQRSGNYYESIVANYWISFCYYRQNKPKESLAILEPLIPQCEHKRYLWILNRLLYLMSIVQFKLNEQSRAMDFANRSADLAESIGDKVGMINALSSLIEYYRYLGDHQRAFNCIKRGFGVVDAIALDPVQGARHYGFVATAFASANLFAASADYQQMALQFALQSGRSAAISSNYAFLALTNWKLGNYDEARRNSQLAYDIAHSHSDGPDDRNLMAYASLQMANASRLAGDSVSAIENYTRSIQLYTALDLPTHLYQAHKGRMLCYLAESNDQLAKNEISTAISLAEKYRTKIFEGNSRDTFFDAEQQVYDTAIEFAYSRMHNTDEAFQYSENSRGRSLLDLINAETPRVANERGLDLVFQSFSESLPLSEIKQRLPPEIRLVQYAVLEDKLLIWVVSPNGAESFSKSIAASELTEKVLEYLAAASAAPAAGQSSHLPVARELFNILIAPIESQLVGKEVCIVPDKVLNLLPFAALMSPAGRYFVEDHVLEISPSASTFIKCTEIAKDKAGEIEGILSVGNPAFDRETYSYLSDLPSALREAKEVASLYGSRKPLIGAEATTVSVKAEMEGAEVIHFAVHSLIDKQFPLRSKFVFAKSRGGSAETLSAYEVYAMTLPRTRLVVLSSCQSGVERYYKGEGMIGLARPFIAAQVPLVVASMWPVESDSSTEIMISFHKHRAQEKIPTAEALAVAQREMLRNPDERYRQPYYWAAFTVIGGHANF